jgi:hypothetical protein
MLPLRKVSGVKLVALNRHFLNNHVTGAHWSKIEPPIIDFDCNSLILLLRSIFYRFIQHTETYIILFTIVASKNYIWAFRHPMKKVALINKGQERDVDTITHYIS